MGKVNPPSYTYAGSTSIDFSLYYTPPTYSCRNEFQTIKVPFFVHFVKQFRVDSITSGNNLGEEEKRNEQNLVIFIYFVYYRSVPQQGLN